MKYFVSSSNTFDIYFQCTIFQQAIPANEIKVEISENESGSESFVRPTRSV